MPRIVTLIASATEIVCALGLSEQLVGISHECDYPQHVLRLPRCSETKFPTDGTSYDIDQRVKAIVQEGLSVYRVLGDRLQELQPSHIITQTQCEVCAVSPRDLAEATCELVASNPQIVALHCDALKDLWVDIQRVADALDVAERGHFLIQAMQGQMEQIGKQAIRIESKPRVAYIEWIDPLMAGGNWMPELIALAGGINLFGQAGTHSPWMTFEALAAADPEVIVIAPCGFDIARSQKEMPALTTQEGWSNIRAVQDGRVYIADGNAYFNRPGPRLLDSLEILAEIFHPGTFHFGHEHVGWHKWGHC